MDVEIFIAVQKKKAGALLRLSPSNTITPLQEYSFPEAPEKAVCHKSSALIQFPTFYKLLDLNSKILTPILEVSEKEAPIETELKIDFISYSYLLTSAGKVTN
ncbi:unnamed protein product [Oikopleura dioica]|uniref:Uncharacterized protein n=1 Tax=Oikopleura dioica TaxID=34765 RepID=E4XSW7_OIKDI|nr:unnamed protein product [Oikopleura dioica]